MSINKMALAARPPIRLKWGTIFWVSMLQVGVVLAPFAFSWSGLVVALILYALTGLGITMGFHRLLTHRSFQTNLAIEYWLAFLGSLANQGSPMQWVAAHRAHHRHSDEDGDPHTPRDGFWWAHMFWWMPLDPILDDPRHYVKYVPDLARDPIHRLLNHGQVILPLALAALLYVLGEAWDGVGFSWVVWGIFVRTAFVYHTTWLVNSATHRWGYRTHRTRDHSTNLWWVALLTFGEGWHNNHHAHPRSARHGLRWWEVDVTYYLIRMMSWIALARNVHVPGRILSRKPAPARALKARRSCVRSGSRPASRDRAMETQTVIDRTRRWIASVVIGLNLCPFAQRVFAADRIRYIVTDAADQAALLNDLTAELKALAAAPIATVETTLLIHPLVLRDFLDYNDFLSIGERLVADLGLEGTLQIASFHPDYRFAGMAADAVENYTNRSPYPMLHLLREASISEVAGDPDELLEIPRRNIATMRRLGLKEMLKRLEEVNAAR